jgi:hypothetical protein
VFIYCAVSVIGHLAADSARSQTKSILKLYLSSDAPQRLHEASDPLIVIQVVLKMETCTRVSCNSPFIHQPSKTIPALTVCERINRYLIAL